MYDFKKFLIYYLFTKTFKIAVIIQRKLTVFHHFLSKLQLFCSISGTLQISEKYK